MLKYLVLAVVFACVIKMSVDTHQEVTKQRVRHLRLSAAYRMMYDSMCSRSDIKNFGDTFSDLSADITQKGIVMRCGDLVNKFNSSPRGYYDEMNDLCTADARRLHAWMNDQYANAYLQLLYWFDCGRFLPMKTAFIALGINVPAHWTTDVDNSCSTLRTCIGGSTTVVLGFLIIAGCTSAVNYIVAFMLRNCRVTLRNFLQNNHTSNSM
jgi:hypothetical protein